MHMCMQHMLTSQIAFLFGDDIRSELAGVVPPAVLPVEYGGCNAAGLLPAGAACSG